MSAEAPKVAKRKSRSTPWAKLAREIQAINPNRSAKEVDQQAYTIWFTAACPITSALIKDNAEAFSEMYEQSSGRFVQDEGASQEE